MITISWHLLLLIVIALIGFGYVMSLDDTDKMLGSARGWGLILYFFILIIVFLIYGGIVWW